MCGIAGVLTHPASLDGRDVVDRILDHQFARGPDWRALTTIDHASHQLVLGHNRLAIVDRTGQSNQPFWSADRAVCTVFNGEIYNHRELRDALTAEGVRLSTDGDTEVLVEAYRQWGVEGFGRLNGMFAFALHDAAQGRLILGRDRFGVKPLYYHVAGDRLCFASSAEAVAREFGLGPDLAYAARGLRSWVYDDDDVAPFAGVRALPPGHYAVVDCRSSGPVTLTRHAYYDLEGRVATMAQELARSTTDSLLEMLEHLLAQAIALRAYPEVPVGISLSGGLDSSTLAALVNAQAPVVGFTFGDPDDPASEAPAVNRLVDHAGIEVVFIRADAGELAGAYLDTIAAQAAPFPTGSIVAQHLVYRAARTRGIRVMLGGQGSDEVFMGYRKFQVFRLLQLAHQRRIPQALAFLATLVPDAIAELPRAANYWRIRHRYTRADGMSTVLALPEALPSALRFDPDRPLWARQIQDIRHASLPTLLRYEDRNSMAHSIESRLPYLDYPLVEFALALPVALKLRHGYRKWIMRRLAHGLIPETIRKARYKRGFDVAQGEWIRGGLGAAMRRELHERAADVRPYLRSSDPIDRLFCDDRLARDPAAFGEVTTLLWLSDAARGTVGVRAEAA